ncbi:MAG: hypothetical protein HFH68_09060 [Lachnospiraceae bacterium]|nr:hypothetical protein [Lachnospiraceae bacterium]
MKKENDNTSSREAKNQTDDNTVHKFFVNNAGMKLISVIIAVVVWAVIINIDDPYKTRSFNVEVETINENALNSVNKVYEIIEGSTAVVKVKGKKSVVDRLGASDIRATADLADLSAVNAVAIQPSLRKILSSDVFLECSQVLRVSLENKESKQVKVNVIASGEPAEGYTLGECTAKPNMIEVAGGESAVGQIASVRVFLNVNGATEDFTKKLIPVAYDEDGNKVESATLSFSNSVVRVFAQILEDKAVPVKVKIIGEPASGYEYVSTDCLPEEVEIAGTSRRLSRISSVVIPVDISGMTTASSKLEQDIYISDYLPEGITPVAGFENVSIRITLEQVIKKNIDISLSSIGFSSLADGLQAEITGDTDRASLLVSGRASVLNSINSTNINAYVNCNGLTEGVYTLPVIIKDLDESCEVIETSKLKVRIYKGDQQNPDDGTQEFPVTSASMPPEEANTPVPEEGGDEEGTEPPDESIY